MLVYVKGSIGLPREGRVRTTLLVGLDSNCAESIVDNSISCIGADDTELIITQNFYQSWNFFACIFVVQIEIVTREKRVFLQTTGEGVGTGRACPLGGALCRSHPYEKKFNLVFDAIQLVLLRAEPVTYGK